MLYYPVCAYFLDKFISFAYDSFSSFMLCLLVTAFFLYFLCLYNLLPCNTEKLNLNSATEYKYLRQSDCYSISGVDDAEEFRIVMVLYSSFYMS